MRVQVYEVRIQIEDDDQTDSEAGMMVLEDALTRGFREQKEDFASDKMWPTSFEVAHLRGE